MQQLLDDYFDEIAVHRFDDDGDDQCVQYTDTECGSWEIYAATATLLAKEGLSQ